MVFTFIFCSEVKILTPRKCPNGPKRAKNSKLPHFVNRWSYEVGWVLILIREVKFMVVFFTTFTNFSNRKA